MAGQIIRPFGPTLFRARFSERMRLEVIQKSVASAESASKTLAGNIAEENFIDLTQDSGNELTSIIQDYLQQMHGAGVYKPKSELKRISYERIWVNHQKKGEWNPPHTHSGDFSMVGYCQVPPELKDEWKHENQQGQDPVAGKVQWNFGNYLPHSVAVFGPIEPEEGDLYIFPAWLLHFVFPFNADVTRISFSTNFKLVYDE
ncbi:MAG: hypothetical protein ACI9H8_002432 [Lysobacterales bacterium]|jgi:hypothetical protein